VTRVDWHTLRTRPAVTSDGDEENWRLDPLIAGGGVLADHGWHVFYVVQGWIGEAPQSVSARLETRRHTRWSVEEHGDRAARLRARDGRDPPHVGARRAAQLGCGDGRRRHDRAPGRHARAHRGGDSTSRWLCHPRCPAAGTIPTGSRRWQTSSSPRLTGQAPRGANLDEASLCAALEHSARTSSLAAAAASRSQGCRADGGLLLVVPPEPGVAERVPPRTVVAGLPLLRRIVLAGARAGFADIRVHKALAGAEDLLAEPAPARSAPTSRTRHARRAAS